MGIFSSINWQTTALLKYSVEGNNFKFSGHFDSGDYTWTNPAGSRKFFAGLEVRDLRDFVVLMILEQCALGKNDVQLNSKNILLNTFYEFFLKFNILYAIQNVPMHY